MVVEIEIVANMNIIIPAKTYSRPCRPSASHNVPRFNVGFRQNNGQPFIRTGTRVAHKLSVGRIHPQPYLKSNIGAVGSIELRREMNGRQQIHIVILLHTAG